LSSEPGSGTTAMVSLPAERIVTAAVPDRVEHG
jgi:hypothetical protein